MSSITTSTRLKKQRSVRLSIEAWAELHNRSVLEGKSASELCDFLLIHYLGLGEPPVYQLPDGLVKRTRAIYIADQGWAAAKRLSRLQGRTLSAMLEQLVRGYVGLGLGSPSGER